MPAELRLEPCRSALNRVHGMPFEWTLNPYMGCAHRCTFCYVRAFEQRADRPADDRYGRSIRVKTNVVQVLRAELSRSSWQGKLVLMGGATDPYQPAEGRYQLTRGCIEALSERRNPFSIITRGPMVIRDVDVLAEASRRARVSVSLSIPTLEDAVWRVTEPGTAHPRQRLRAVRVLADAGIRVGVALAPIIPGISDRPGPLMDAIRAARDAGASRLWTELLYLKPGTREHFLETLATAWPAEAERLSVLYAKAAYRPRAVNREHVATVAAMARTAPRRPSAPPTIEPEAPRLAMQLGLAFGEFLAEAQ